MWLVAPCAALSMAIAADRFLSSRFRGARPVGPVGGAVCGGLMAAGYAAAAIVEAGESLFSPGNHGDLALAALVLGVPAGVAAVASAAGFLVDTKDSGA